MKYLFLAVLFFAATYSHAQAKPEDTEYYTPVPAKVTPGEGSAASSDAIVLFNGANTDEWVMVKDNAACKWNLNKEEHSLTVAPSTGAIQTKRSFGDC